MSNVIIICSVACANEFYGRDFTSYQYNPHDIIIISPIYVSIIIHLHYQYRFSYIILVIVVLKYLRNNFFVLDWSTGYIHNDDVCIIFISVFPKFRNVTCKIIIVIIIFIFVSQQHNM